MNSHTQSNEKNMNSTTCGHDIGFFRGLASALYIIGLIWLGIFLVYNIGYSRGIEKGQNDLNQRLQKCHHIVWSK